MTKSQSEMLAGQTKRMNGDVLAFLLRSLPDRPGEPGIVVIRSPETLKTLSVSNGEIIADGRVVARTKDVAGLTFFHSRHPVEF